MKAPNASRLALPRLTPRASYQLLLGFLALTLIASAVHSAFRAAGLWQFGWGVVSVDDMRDFRSFALTDMALWTWRRWLTIPTGIAFLVWVYDTVRAVHRVSEPDENFPRPLLAVGTCIAPLVNLVATPRLVLHIRRKLSNDEPSGAPVAVWWGLTLAGFAASVILRHPFAHAYGKLLALALITGLSIGLGGAMLLALVVEIERLLRDRRIAQEVALRRAERAEASTAA